MFGSTILEVAIGLGLLFLFLSIVSSQVSELISRYMGLRSRELEAGIRNLLRDSHFDEHAKKVYEHPMVAHLSLPNRKRRPSYIPARSFAVALLDTVAPAEDGKSPTVKSLRSTVDKIENPYVRAQLLSIIDNSEDDLVSVRAGVEAWYDDAMDRVSGWYKRRLQTIILAIALFITLATNADSLMIANNLFRDATLRSTVVAAAQSSAAPVSAVVSDLGQTEATQVAPNVQNLDLQQLHLPLGWSTDAGSERALPDGFSGWTTKIIGLLLTALAVSLGAPFWFDTLNKMINLRMAGAKPARGTDQG